MRRTRGGRGDEMKRKGARKEEEGVRRGRGKAEEKRRT